MAIELNFNPVVMSPRIREGIASSPKLTHTGGEIAGLQVLYPFCPLMLIYDLSNLQIEIPYLGITGIGMT